MDESETGSEETDRTGPPPPPAGPALPPDGFPAAAPQTQVFTHLRGEFLNLSVELVERWGGPQGPRPPGLMKDKEISRTRCATDKRFPWSSFIGPADAKQETKLIKIKLQSIDQSHDTWK